MKRAAPLLAFALGCLPHGRVETPEPDYAMPDRFTPPAEGVAATAPAPEEGDDRWWLRYEDPTLHALVEQSLGANVSLRARWAALQQARALATQAAAARYPQVSAQGGVSFNRSFSAIGTSRSLQVSGSLPVSYEVDLFGRWRGQHEAAELDAEATRLDIETLALSTSAQVAEAWYSVVDARARQRILAEQLEVNERYLELTRLRFEQGLANALDVHQQRRQTQASRAQLELVDDEVALLVQQLAVLLGQPPSELGGLEARDQFPPLGPTPATAVPATVVWARPDVRAAQQRVRAADWRVGSAIASRLPSIRLSVTPGYAWQRNELDSPAFPDRGAQTANDWTFNAGATLTVPLFDGFAGRGQVEANEAALQAQVETLSQTVLNALLEVEGALVQERQQKRNVELLEEQVAIAEETLTSARDRYRSGLSDFLPVLTALVAQQGAQLNLQAAKRQLVSRRIQLHRALGGDWP
ncbi:MAG TPA: TolC family protein, partial [Polyangiaceae bacterium LLY-WYZ-15_(1-7)]|nr:TolC family protein [Polyangiaceae bacterium LLY-WYZ-15_(1-7)]